MEFTATVEVVQPVSRPTGEKAVRVILTSPSPPITKATEKKPAAATVIIGAGEPQVQLGEEIRFMMHLTMEEWNSLKHKFVFGDEWTIKVDTNRIKIVKR